MPQRAAVDIRGVTVLTCDVTGDGTVRSASGQKVVWVWCDSGSAVMDSPPHADQHAWASDEESLMVSRHSPSRTSSALQVAQYVFTRSACEPTTLWLDGAQFDGLPDGRLLLVPLRDLLLRPATTPTTRDAVWRELIARARGGESWLVAALGMAMPGLRRAVRQLTVGGRWDRDDVESAVAEGFVAALHTVDLADRALCGRLVTAGRRAGAKQLYQDAAVDTAVWSQFASAAPRAPWGHPDFVLLAAVAAGVLSMAEAQLIGVTRLEKIPIADLAADLGLPTNTLVKRRRRAEERVRDAIGTGLVTSRYDMIAADMPPAARVTVADAM